MSAKPVTTKKRTTKEALLELLSANTTASSGAGTSTSDASTRNSGATSTGAVANAPEFLSGESAAEQLGVSRTAIWKAVDALRNDGYAIEAVTNKGYRLTQQADVLSADAIKEQLPTWLGGGRRANTTSNPVSQPKAPSTDDGSHTDPSPDANASTTLPIQLELLPTTTSTLDVARQRAHEGAPEGLVILAEEQTAGRGRRGRAFYSPKGTSVYLSIILRPHNATAEEVAPVTAMAAVAVSRAIEDIAPVEAQIKWVNDIFVNGRKVCGILTEGAFDLESNAMGHLSVGIGVDVYPPLADLPAEFAGTVGHLLPEPCHNLRNLLAARIVERFFQIYAASPLGAHLDVRLDDGAAGPLRPKSCPDPLDHVREYRERCFVIGRKVMVQKGIEPPRPAVALDVNDECQLLVRYEDDSEELLSYGEISVAVNEHD